MPPGAAWCSTPRAAATEASTWAPKPPVQKCSRRNAAASGRPGGVDLRRRRLPSEYGIERFYRDVRLFRLFEGTTQIQQLVIARNMIPITRAEPATAPPCTTAKEDTTSFQWMTASADRSSNRRRRTHDPRHRPPTPRTSWRPRVLEPSCNEHTDLEIFREMGAPRPARRDDP